MCYYHVCVRERIGNTCYMYMCMICVYCYLALFDCRFSLLLFICVSDVWYAVVMVVSCYNC